MRKCISNRRDAVGQDNFIFLDDNARAYRAAVVMEALEDLQINHLPLPPRSPDLNAIEHVWDLLQRQLDNHLPHPATIRELAEILPIAFNEIPQDQIDNCIRSMPERCQAVADVRGNTTRY